MFLSIKQDNREVFDTLLQRGANVHTKNRYSYTPLEIAIIHAQHEIEKILVKKGAQGWTPLMTCYKGDVANVKKLLANGADVNVTDPGESTPLMLACHKANVDICKLLISYNSWFAYFEK